MLSLGLLVYCTFIATTDQVMPNALTSVFCLLYVGLTLIVLPVLRESEGNGLRW